MKYDAQLTELKNLLPNVKNILIALPVGADIDKLASGLSLYLNLTKAGKQVSIVCETDVTVAQTNLVGVDKIQKTVTQPGTGDYIVTLEGVASENGTIPALEKLDWYPEGNNLNLVFHTLPGQTFQPSNVIPKPASTGFDLIFTIGANTVMSLGSIYAQNVQLFSGIHLANLDNQPTNTNFGQTNINDVSASSISEILTDVIPALGLTIDSDTATNLLAGIFDSTANLTNQKVGADTYLAVATNMKIGGRKPASETAAQPSLGFGINDLQPQQLAPIQSGPAATAGPADVFTMPPVVPTTPPVTINSAPFASIPSPEDTTSAPEPGWLTPKVFKGSSIG